MNTKFFPVIDLAATGNNIRRLRIERGLTVRDIQSYFGFEELGNLLGVPMDQILVPVKNIKSYSEQQEDACCSSHFYARLFRMRQKSDAA